MGILQTIFKVLRRFLIPLGRETNVFLDTSNFQQKEYFD